jgi:hypothetical protein
MKAGIVVGHFPQVAKGAFGNHAVDFRLDGSGLQGDCRAHRFTQFEDTVRMLRSHERLDHSARVITFPPTVSRLRAIAGAVGARIHHHNAVPSPQ